MGYKYIQKVYLTGWLIATVIWYIVRISNVETGDYINLQRIVFFLTTWLSQGILYGVLFYFITRYVTKRVWFYQLLGIALLTQLGVALLIIATLYPVISQFNYIGFPSSFVRFMLAPTVVFGTLFSLFVNAIISTTMSASLILGQGVLKNIISGKYYTPRKEKRIFMFLDLHDSTNIAEKLGHLPFSMLIQDCFYELSVFNKFRGEIYKYVGDEAIITWPFGKSSSANNSIDSFFAFTDILEDKKTYFIQKYGVMPSFKAGIHVGSVTVTEIGKTKREIAYLGDTVNTTARIQGECNRQKSKLLISEELLKVVRLEKSYIVKEKGSFILRGKNESINIYAVNRMR